jgi:hypothetical protein
MNHDIRDEVDGYIATNTGWFWTTTIVVALCVVAVIGEITGLMDVQRIGGWIYNVIN